MNERPLFDPLAEHIVTAQRSAADPRASIWVEANAGSGKTRVLTDRVLRLMLAGVRPDQILCLTYTKAAAAEMRQRVSDRLADWALCTDVVLRKGLCDLLGEPPPDAMLSDARTLFATALETPGGLKIQTIHAFCEAVLHRFPVEAGVPFDFGVLEDFEREQLILSARETIMAAGLDGQGPAPGAVTALFDALSDHALGEAIAAALASGGKLRALLADRAGAKRRLRRLVGMRQSDSSATLLAEIASLYPFGTAEHAEILAVCPPEPGGSRFEDKLARLDLATLVAEDLIGCYLTADGTIPKSFPKKLIRDRLPDLALRLESEALRLERLASRLRRARLVERSDAIIDLLGAIIDSYESRKRARSLLDFDDLVQHLADLLANRPEGQWVRYKLDGGLHHILVDESQDTNPAQWRVVRALAEEFFEPGGIEGLRTLFAVGDGKQSIYSFQGAEPEEFRLAGTEYNLRALAATVTFATVRLRTSFRTLPGVLEAVDRVFAQPALQAAVLEDLAISHSTARRDAGGTVTLWPPIQELKPDDLEGETWPTEVPPDTRSAVRQVAERIAAEIKGWIGIRPLAARGRTVAAEDVLILVQSRSALFHEIIRALRNAGLPTPGADRLAVTTHIAVLDLMALGDVLLNPEDDLQLAAVLRSPLFDITDDDLIALAPGRAPGVTLWQALAESAMAKAKAASTQLQNWRARLDLDRPYDFFARILGAEGGLLRFHARMGREVDDVFAEFLELALAQEQTSQPSLQGFLAQMRGRDVTIRRELSERAAGIRVMTVHGAKGLEAPIVILADAASQPRGKQLSRAVHFAMLDGGPLLLHSVSKDDTIPEIGAIKSEDRDRQMAEYWRRLYVAMTRAEDELYLTGALTASAKLDGSWYQVVEDALLPHASRASDQSLHFPRERVPPRPAAAASAAGADPEQPLRLAPLPQPILRPWLVPSQLVPHAAPTALLGRAAETIRDAEAARRAGLALHALLQHLPTVPAGLRASVATKALMILWPEGSETHPGLAARALSILARPEFADLFGPESRAEVPFLASGTRHGAPVNFAGRIDRLVVTGERVLVVDFKSDAVPPATAADVNPAYLVQLALYARVAGQLFPNRHVDAAILWTSLESLLELPHAALAEAARQFTIG